MRTGYTDTLMAPITPAEERRLQLEREEEQRRREEELARQAEERRLAAERAVQEQQARQVEEQRAEAERLAHQRRLQRQRAAAEAARAEAATAAAAAAAPKPEPAAPAPPQPQPDESMLPAPAVPAMAAPSSAAEEAEAARRQQVEEERRQQREAEELQREKDEALARQREAEVQAPAAKSTDGIVQAVVALRKRYKDSDPAGLATCMQTLRVYINNLARNPHDPKFQRINCDNNAFRNRVVAFEGASAVLLACGFQEEAGALVVGPDFVKTKGSRLWDALAKVDVMIEQLKAGS